MKIFFIFFLILTLSITILSPITLEVSTSENDVPYIAKLNVCHSGTAFLADGADMPCFIDSESIQLKPVETSSLEIFYQLYTDLFIPSQEEKPPRA